MKKILVPGLIFLTVLISIAGCTRSLVPSSPVQGGPSSAPATSSLSNGRNIYFHAASDYGDTITYSGVTGMMMQGTLTCATCHGAEGHGGSFYFMMQSYDVPNITWPELTGPDPDMEHPPYTEETLKRAITDGLDPGGNQLEYPMPRWQIPERDLNDLVAFIKTLK